MVCTASLSDVPLDQHRVATYRNDTMNALQAGLAVLSGGLVGFMLGLIGGGG